MTTQFYNTLVLEI